MVRHFIVSVLFVLGSLKSHAMACPDVLSKKFYAKTEHYLSENAPVVNKIIGDLSAFKKQGQLGDPYYKNLINEIQLLIVEATKIKELQYPQSRLTNLVLLYSELVDGPIFSSYLDGASISQLRKQLIELEFAGFKDGRERTDLIRKIHTVDGEPLNLPYVFKFGLFTPMEWLETLAQGKVLISLSDKAPINFDGRSGRSALYLVLHDFGHISILLMGLSKYDYDPHSGKIGPYKVDSEKFEKLISKVRHVLAEIRKLRDPGLREQYSSALFFLIHESYAHEFPESHIPQHAGHVADFNTNGKLFTSQYSRDEQLREIEKARKAVEWLYPLLNLKE